MGLLEGLKNRLIHRKPEFQVEDVRSHILGDLQTERRDTFNFEDPLKNRFDPYAAKNPYQPGPQQREPVQAFERDPLQMEPKESNYEIIDKLNIMEAQISAIRSQTETINERLKNIEMKLNVRRY